MDTYRIYDSTDEHGIVGTVAPGLFAKEGRCWRMVYENRSAMGRTACSRRRGWAVDVPRWLDEGLVVRASRGPARGR